MGKNVRNFKGYNNSSCSNGTNNFKGTYTKKDAEADVQSQFNKYSR